MSKDLSRNNKHPIPKLFESLGIDEVKPSDQFSLNYRDGLLEAHVKKSTGQTITAVRHSSGRGFHQLTEFNPDEMSREDRNGLIRKMYNSGKTQVEVARIFGLSQSMIARIVAG